MQVFHQDLMTPDSGEPCIPRAGQLLNLLYRLCHVLTGFILTRAKVDHNVRPFEDRIAVRCFGVVDLLPHSAALASIHHSLVVLCAGVQASLQI